MKKTLTCLLLWWATISMAAADAGVPLRLAQQRAAALRNISYTLTFRIPDKRSEPVTGDAEISFERTGSDDLTLDFAGTDLTRKALVNGRSCTVKWQDEHVTVASCWLKQGRNVIRLSFTSAEKSLNRNDEYLYTLFVPANARSVFPCFDQPDLKARFSLRLQLPEGWTSIDSADPQHPIPTYLFSFVAGRFHEQTALRDGRPLRVLYRETDPQKTAQMDQVFDLVALSLRWLEEYTGMPYPFSQYSFAVLPGYQFGSMEHPGAIQYLDRKIFLGPHPTPDEELSRLELIAHETAHMWFGDLVTMRWFNDVWTKEVFANFLAAKISREEFPHVNHELNFLKAYQVPALATDRTDGTHAIQQPLDNLNRAGLLYGNIIYDKAPVMMRKMEQLIGPQTLRRGLQRYLRRFAYANATWDDLIEVLAEEAPGSGVERFSETWVKRKGLPEITTAYDDGQVTVRQTDPLGRGLQWQQQFTIGLFYSDREPIEELIVNLRDGEAKIPVSRVPTAVLPNYDGSGYGRFKADAKTLDILGTAWQYMPDDLHTYAALMTLYENYQLRRISAGAMMNLLHTWLLNTENELVASTIGRYIASVYLDLNGQNREMAEYFIMNAATKHPLKPVQKQMLKLIGSVAEAPAIVDTLYGIWRRHDNDLLTERDYSSIAWHLAIMRPAQWQEIIRTQRQRLHNADELREFDYVARACHPDTAEQRKLFFSLIRKENRGTEPWARELLGLLCCSARENISNSYITPGLEALQDIQRTSDIFFPGYWLGALLSQHRSREAREAVRKFISTHPDYPETLMNKLKENAYPLLR